MDDMLENMAARLFADRCTPALIRAVEAGTGQDQLAALWQEITATGLCDSLVGAGRLRPRVCRASAGDFVDRSLHPARGFG